LVLLAAGLAPALLKKSKPLARYMGDQLIRAGEYLKEGTEEVVEAATTKMSGKTAPSASTAAKPKPKPRAKPKTTTSRKPASSTQAKKPKTN
jgi:hypothetical protein